MFVSFFFVLRCCFEVFEKKSKLCTLTTSSCRHAMPQVETQPCLRTKYNIYDVYINKRIYRYLDLFEGMPNRWAERRITKPNPLRPGKKHHQFSWRVSTVSPACRPSRTLMSSTWQGTNSFNVEPARADIGCHEFLIGSSYWILIFGIS